MHIKHLVIFDNFATNNIDLYSFMDNTFDFAYN